MDQTVYVAYGNEASSLFPLFVEHMPSLKDSFSTDDFVVIKPNVLLPKDSDSGATTDPALVEQVIVFLKEIGIEKIAIAEGSWVGAQTDESFMACGYMELAARHDVDLIDLKKDDFVDITIPLENSILKKVRIAQTVLEATKLINLPVLKAHCQSQLTCGMKNLMGILSDSEKRRFHHLDLPTCIFELNVVCRPTLNVCDAIIGDLTFEEGGTPVQFGRIFLSFDAYSLDCYAANVLGYRSEEIHYLRLFREYEGRSEGYEVRELNEPREQSVFHAIDYRSRFDCGIHPSHACCSCLSSIFMALETRGYIAKDIHFYVGTQVREEEIKKEGTAVFIGECTKKYRHLGHWIEGCPPSGLRVREALNAIKK